MLRKCLRPVFQLEVPARTACHLQKRLYFSLYPLSFSALILEDFVLAMLKYSYFYSVITIQMHKESEFDSV